MVKGPKILNPADKARKEARKKELKKNKKQRQQVRSAVIEKKDPEQIIAELEKIDSLEFDITTNPECSDSIHKDRRKRLKETFGKVLAYYLKEDPERHARLTKLESDYDAKHKRSAREFEAIKAAQEVKIEDVFLPPEPNSAIDEIADDDPLLSESVYVTPLTEGIKPPGCPPGLPPDFKQLVENLKNSLEAQMVLESLPLPANLMAQAALSSNANSRRPTRHQRGKGELAYPNHRQKNQKGTAQISENVTDAQLPTSSSKTTVIESKPEIFMPKATKFVPTSVRSKLARSDPKV